MSARKSPRELADHSELRDLVERFLSVIDRKSWRAAQTLFVRGAIDADVSGLGGRRVACHTAAQLVARLSRQLHVRKTSHHMTSAYEITIRDDLALLKVRGSAWHQLRRDTGLRLWETWGVYHFTCARTTLGWRFTAFRYVPTYSRGDDEVPGHSEVQGRAGFEQRS